MANLGQLNIMTIGRNKHRTLFLSDFHLGSHQCKAKSLYEFLWRNDADTIYLIGDIVEGMSLKKWPPYHDDVLRLLAAKSLNGTKLIFIPGNHDSFFRFHIGEYGNLKILKHAHHVRVDGTVLLVIHGDETDLLRLSPLLWLIVKFEHLFHMHLWEVLSKAFGSLIRRHVRSFERRITKLAVSGGFSGIVCGHIHMPRIEMINGTLYLNSGDWTTHCSAIAESYKGELSLIYLDMSV